MPRFDGTGPLSYGMGTGRKMGPCCRGGFYGRRFFTKNEEKNLLKEEIEDLEKEIVAMKERLKEVEDQE
jgi:hypothetical protein